MSRDRPRNGRRQAGAQTARIRIHKAEDRNMSRCVPIAACLIAVATAASAGAADNDWQSKVGQALGKSGAASPDGTYRVGMPRSDLKVTLDGVPLKPGFALGSWVAFRPMGQDAMVMGDLVLTQDEVNPVMKKLKEEGIEITALHNHLLRAEPMTLYMHILGHGDPVQLAQALHAGLALSKTPLEALSGSSQPAAQPQIALNTDVIDQALGRKGKDNAGVYSFTIPRAEPVKEEGVELSPAMGAATGINFQPTGDGTAAITGDFVLTDQEVNPVIQALQENGIEITALHSHMLDEQPRLFFMHFWANDDAQKLAKGLRAALDRMAVKKG
jgi:biotin operon repressor